MTDLMERVRAADPVAEPLAAPPVEWMLARLDVTDASPPAAAWDVGDIAATPGDVAAPAATRARRRRPLLAGLAAAATLAAVGVLAGSWSSPDVVAAGQRGARFRGRDHPHGDGRPAAGRERQPHRPGQDRDRQNAGPRQELGDPIRALVRPGPGPRALARHGRVRGGRQARHPGHRVRRRRLQLEGLMDR